MEKATHHEEGPEEAPHVSPPSLTALLGWSARCHADPGPLCPHHGIILSGTPAEWRDGQTERARELTAAREPASLGSLSPELLSSSGHVQMGRAKALKRACPPAALEGQEPASWTQVTRRVTAGLGGSPKSHLNLRPRETGWGWLLQAAASGAACHSGDTV